MVSLPYGLPYVAGIVTTITTIDLQDHSNSTVGNITTAQLLTGRGNAFDLYGLLIKVLYDKYKFRGKNVCRIEKHMYQVLLTEAAEKGKCVLAHDLPHLS